MTAKTDIRINSLDCVGIWSYRTENSECPLCHQHLMNPTQKSLEERKISNNVIIGSCGHGLHSECIDRWIGSGNISCPICETSWNPEKNVGSAVHIYKTATIVKRTANGNSFRTRSKKKSDEDEDMPPIDPSFPVMEDLLD